jgi:uncharacterized protein YbbK (DUF523 family)
MKTLNSNNTKLNIGVSSCLLGHAVRYDGEHKYHEIIATTLGQTFNLIPFCPEVSAGMGIPRPPIHLVDFNAGLNNDQDDLHAIDKADIALDYTQQLQRQGNKYLTENSFICGYIFQEKSPSCGVASVKIHNIEGKLINTQGTGIFATKILQALPDLPVIEAADLNNKIAVEKFAQLVKKHAKKAQKM